MHNRLPRRDPQDRPKSANQAGVSISAKGESSGSQPLVDPEATLIPFPSVADTQATLVDALATQVDATPPVGSVGRVNSRFQVGVVFQPFDVLAGRYEILKLLGEGGMGAVYKAMDRELNRPVALKVIRPELAANPSILARFKQELLLARQSHPQKCDPHLRPGRRRWREVHHHGVH